MNSCSAVGIVACLTAALSAQQTRPAPDSGVPIRLTVAEAEREGEGYPRGAIREHAAANFARFARHIPGPRKCVNGPTSEARQDLLANPSLDLEIHELRSGDFVIGGQIGGAQAPKAGRTSKIWWIPYHDPFESSTKLLVRGARLGATGDTIRYVQPDYAWPKGSPKTESFFPSGVKLPTPGRWLLIATAGDDWGCFILVAT